MALVKRGDLERKRSREIKPFYTGNQLKWVKGLFLLRAPRPSGSDSIDAILKACHIHCVLKHLIICDSLQRGSLSSAVPGGVMCSIIISGMSRGVWWCRMGNGGQEGVWGCLGSNTGLCSWYLAHGMQVCLLLYSVFQRAVIPVNLHLLWEQMTLVFGDFYSLLL